MRNTDLGIMHGFPFTIILTLLALPLGAQYLQWQRTMGGLGTDEAYAMAMDDEGNLLVTGTFEGTVVFGAETLTAAGGTDFFVLKANTAGAILWVKTFGGALDDAAYSIVSGNQGNAYVAGAFSGMVAFDPAAPAAFDTSMGSIDIFLLQLDANGNFKRVRTMGGPQDDLAFEVDCHNERVFLTGFFSDTVNFDPGTSVFRFGSKGDNDAYVARLDTQFNIVWAKAFGGPGSDLGIYIEIDDTGAVYISGEFQQSVDFDPGPGLNSQNSSGGWDGFLLQLDQNGIFIWVRTIQGWDFEACGRSIIDADGSIYLAGLFTGNTDLDPGPNMHIASAVGMFDSYILKLDAAGNRLWSIEIGDAGQDILQNMCLDAAGNLYAAGSIQRSGQDEVFILRLDTSGQVVWTYETGSQGFDGAYGVAADDDGNLYVCGSFSDTISFNPFDPSHPGQAESTGSRDIFLAKLTAGGFPTSTNAVGNPPALTLFPNPANNRLNLQALEGWVPGDAFAILSSTGKLVGSGKIDPNSKRVAVDISRLAAGPYFIQLDSKAGHAIQPFMRLNR